jgi:hypothetical protein
MRRAVVVRRLARYHGIVTTAPAILHPPSDGSSVNDTTPLPRARIGLVSLERLGSELLFDGTAGGEIREWLVDMATVLAGNDANGARIRLLARSLASARAQVAVLEAMVAERVAERDPAGLALVDRALTNASRRLVTLIAEHRRTHAPERPVVVAVEHAHVNVIGSR